MIWKQICSADHKNRAQWMPSRANAAPGETAEYALS